MNDVKLAMLGNKEAAKRLTDAGVMVPCPGCGGDDFKECDACGDHFVACKVCGWSGPMKNSPAEARLDWNTRVAVEMEGME